VRFLIALPLLLAGCSAEVRLGCGPRHTHQPSRNHLEGACELVLTQRFGERGYCSYAHISEPQDGNGGDESETDIGIDQGMCGVIWGGR
jgi:hypothetical protein